ncbi:dihydrolipoyllysine-residue acetyltransferase component of pyruvate dehydrogenase complex [Agrilactobacillus composti DSM 18527 = JCM 14202]|uniref:Dihydrolipoamide acetyltransferase component of pyruvate dehydrogenase complex n=1 Tax=Agrilactobacillus composti DSM 18527 = JCM 14202 TaxID=1423734 RepID=X0PDK0_9LACO|nr:dihydrolipoyllysine-residue acetyltransferase [Agrilactobacillus composti]KRM36613.1 dihydrolipoyllysine-residue acetyltransferase component of pyruvate dehydrogenase complex [Agrilactobacillus composti DSM 18527 = JCM 14202]GAF39058.1 dihydrolipoamide acetyltransferase component of pyruvate dehydrogenase complex [Agrilactobacillus composti DSM 18527 = JCM 14202]
MAYQFKLPELGEGIVEGEIVKWHVKVGDTINEDDTLLEVQNDKSVEEIPSPVTGKVLNIMANEGDTVEVGQPLIEIDAPGAAGNDTPAATPAAAAPTAAPAATPAPTASSSADKVYQFKLPELGEGIVEGEIVKWHVKVGDTINEDDTLLEVQNDKSVEEIPSPVTGKVTNIVANEGDTVEVGQVLVEIDAPGHNDATPVGAGSSAPAATPANAPEPQVQNAASGPAAVTPNNVVAISDPNREVLAMPSVRQYAREHDVDISQVPATGNHNRITKQDVDNFIAGGTSAPAVAPASTAAPASAPTATAAPAAAETPKAYTSTEPDREVREKMSPTRRAIAKAMTTSKHTAPHVTIFDDVEVSKLMAHRKKYKTVAADRGIHLTFLAYVVKALVVTVKDYPDLNASIDDVAQEIVHKNYFNIGIATNTPHGLYVPNIKDADKKSIFEIAKEISENAELAKDNKLKPQSMRSGTITISNIGSIGGGWFTPVINYPEVAILGFGRIAKEPYVTTDGQIAVGAMMKLSLSFDHRLIDGAYAQEAMNELKKLLADPELLLMEG